MATLKKKKNRLGSPPPITETLNNLAEPETAPAPKKQTSKSKAKVDGRTLRKTGRTEQFNTRVTKEYKNKLYSVAKKEKKTIGTILELALDAYTKR